VSPSSRSSKRRQLIRLPVGSVGLTERCSPSWRVANSDPIWKLASKCVSAEASPAGWAILGEYVWSPKFPLVFALVNRSAYQYFRTAYE
jgi:hypothetical protein